jgi:protein TonB
MNALADMTVSPPLPLTKSKPALERARPTSPGLYFVAWLTALALHAVVLFGVSHSPRLAENIEFAMENSDTNVSVTLVAAMPADPVEAAESPPEPPPVVEPLPEPIPEPPVVMEKPPEVTLPEPEPPPPPKPPHQVRPKPEKVPPKPRPQPRASRAIGDGSSPVPGMDATSSVTSAGLPSTKPSYLRNPKPPYPPAARAAGQEGTVKVEVMVDAEGRPASVRIGGSSGFPLLDESARSTVATRWRFKPARTASGMAVSSPTTIPIRFQLDDR